MLSLPHLHLTFLIHPTHVSLSLSHTHHEAVLVCAQDLEHCLTGCPEVALNAADLHGLDHHARQAERHLGVWMWVWGGGGRGEEVMWDKG